MHTAKIAAPQRSHPARIPYRLHLRAVERDGGGLGLPGGALSAAAAQDPRKTPDWVEIGDVSSLAPVRPVEMVFRRNRVDGWKIISEKSTAWVVKIGR